MENIRLYGPVCTCDTARIDEPLPFVFVDFVFVCVTSDEDIDVKLPLYHGETMGITPRYYLVTVDKTFAIKWLQQEINKCCKDIWMSPILNCPI